jgi:hypothetical protein
MSSQGNLGPFNRKETHYLYLSRYQVLDKMRNLAHGTTQISRLGTTRSFTVSMIWHSAIAYGIFLNGKYFSPMSLPITVRRSSLDLWSNPFYYWRRSYVVGGPFMSSFCTTII